ncbi:MAG: hypothetical protein IJF90_07605 [Synergistaceae bacterium]|nr:hypothetical protein [Synergistaceae bacterium]MBQ3653603.1 hypothetical protein [Synergistaceae bacterium]
MTFRERLEWAKSQPRSKEQLDWLAQNRRDVNRNVLRGVFAFLAVYVPLQVLIAVLLK